MWQQLGRAGRGAQDAAGVLIARDDPLDTYLVHHPEALLGRPVEATVFDPGNPYVLGPHLCAAAQERPLTTAELDLFGPDARGVVDALTDAGLLRRRPSGWYWTDRRRAADLADIRSTGGAQVQLVESETGRVVGTVDGGRAHSSAHRGAVYVHRGETYLVESLDLDDHVAVIARADPDYSTSAREITDITVVQERIHRMWGECRLSCGEVDVSHQVVSFLKRRQPQRRGDRRGAAGPAGPHAAHHRGLVDGPGRRADRGRSRPLRCCPARRTPPSTARSGCCRSSRPVTAGTSAGSRPPGTPTPAGSRSSSTTGTPAAPGSPSGATGPRSSG